MAALRSCQAFIPMYVYGAYHCARCGLTLDYHQAHDDNGMLFFPNVINHAQLHLYQQPQLQDGRRPEPYPERSVVEHGVIPNNNWHDLPIDIMLLQLQPAEPNYQPQLENNNEDNRNTNNNNNNNNNNGNRMLPRIRSWVFSEYQIDRMFTMAGRYQWNLRGHSRNEELHQFCVEIGISWTQFCNWVHRNRARFGHGYNQLR